MRVRNGTGVDNAGRCLSGSTTGTKITGGLTYKPNSTTKMEYVKLEDLVGKRMLSGVDFVNASEIFGNEDEYKDARAVSFTLNWITYTAIEDPIDGYRSAMQDICISSIGLKNTFSPCEVLCTLRPGDDTNVLDMIDTGTCRIVLSVGTDYSDNYYPCFIAEFSPENLSVNNG
jgi:hypothetical protein